MFEHIRKQLFLSSSAWEIPKEIWGHKWKTRIPVFDGNMSYMAYKGI